MTECVIVSCRHVGRWYVREPWRPAEEGGWPDPVRVCGNHVTMAIAQALHRGAGGRCTVWPVHAEDRP